MSTGFDFLVCAVGYAVVKGRFLGGMPVADCVEVSVEFLFFYLSS